MTTQTISFWLAMLLIRRVTVLIQLFGKHWGDLDNLAGSCLDALVSTNILLDDLLSCVPSLRIEHKPEGKRGCWVQITPLL